MAAVFDSRRAFAWLPKLVLISRMVRAPRPHGWASTFPLQPVGEQDAHFDRFVLFPDHPRAASVKPLVCRQVAKLSSPTFRKLGEAPGRWVADYGSWKEEMRQGREVQQKRHNGDDSCSHLSYVHWRTVSQYDWA
jgi:hypothetical protein